MILWRFGPKRLSPSLVVWQVRHALLNVCCPGAVAAPLAAGFWGTAGKPSDPGEMPCHSVGTWPGTPHHLAARCASDRGQSASAHGVIPSERRTFREEYLLRPFVSPAESSHFQQPP